MEKEEVENYKHKKVVEEVMEMETVVIYKHRVETCRYVEEGACNCRHLERVVKEKI